MARKNTTGSALVKGKHKSGSKVVKGKHKSGGVLMKGRKTNQADTHIDTIEKKYGRDSGLASNKNLGVYLKEKGYPSLSKLVRMEKSNAKK